MGYFALNHVLFMVFFHAFSLLRLGASRLAWLKIRLVLSALPPCHRVFRSLICVFIRGLAHFNMATKEICWLVGWLVGWFEYVLLGSLDLDKLWLADRSLSCLFLTKYYNQAVFRVIYTHLKHCQNMRFSAIFEKFNFRYFTTV